jgi:hypothetical protein
VRFVLPTAPAAWVARKPTVVRAEGDVIPVHGPGHGVEYKFIARQLKGFFKAPAGICGAASTRLLEDGVNEWF